MTTHHTYEHGFQDGHTEGVCDLAQEIIAAATAGENGALLLPAGELVDRIRADAAQATTTDGETGMLNHYTCPECGEEWQDEWGCEVDDECPACGKRHISPHTSESIRPEVPTRATLDARELATILAALRLWQKGAGDAGAEILSILQTDSDPAGEYSLELTPSEIDSLCERLNTGG